MLRDRVAFITGSTRGIGWATALKLAENGAKVILNGRSDSGLLDARVNELRQRFSRDCSGLLGDISTPAETARFYQEIFRLHKRLDILVNNAGILEDHLIGMIPDDSLQRTYAINVIGAVHNIQAASRLMARHGGGSIINLSSIVGVNGNAGQVAYAGSKAALIGITKSAAKELAPKNIRVNAVAPGFIETDMIRQIPRPIYDERVKSIKMGRIGRPEDVAESILFFASDRSAYITGQVLGVDGGMLI